MKIKVTFEVDAEIFKKFIDLIEAGNSSEDTTTEKSTMAFNVQNDKSDKAEGKEQIAPAVSNCTETELETYRVLTENVLKKYEEYAVGKLVNVIVRGLLERGVASEQEIKEMQKASGKMATETMKMPFGKYCLSNFKISFPLLADKAHREPAPKKFWNKASLINGEEFYICSQWAEKIHRKPVEKWIRKHLPNWFANAADSQRSEMKSFLEVE